MKLMMAPMMRPHENVVVPPVSVGTSHVRSFRLSAWKMRAMSGLMSPVPMALTMPVNAAPMTTATARSMTLPRRMNSLKPLIISRPSFSPGTADGQPAAAGEAFASDFDPAEDDEESPLDEPPEDDP